MAFKLEHVVPWGRSFSEYQRMFSLTEDALRLRILGCADGPAGFNAEATRRGARVVSVDPLYAFSEPEIRERIRTSFPVVLEQTRKNASDFVWNEFASVDELGRARTQTMEEFLADFDAGRQAGRYVSGQLPRLPFEDHAFDLALCAHFLFLYTDHFDQDFHVASIVELCRVAGEVRVFPLLKLGSAPSLYVGPVTRTLEGLGYTVTSERVTYELQRGGNQMMRIVRGAN